MGLALRMWTIPRWHDLGMDRGMTREEAEALAESVHQSSDHEVRILEDDGRFAVQVVRPSTQGADTYTLYDEADWAWLRARVVGH